MPLTAMKSTMRNLSLAPVLARIGHSTVSDDEYQAHQSVTSV